MGTVGNGGGGAGCDATTAGSTASTALQLPHDEDTTGMSDMTVDGRRRKVRPANEQKREK